MKTFVAAAVLATASTAAMAQVNSGEGSDTSSPIAGHWGGFVKCAAGTGWAVFHDIQVSNGEITSQYKYYGSSTGKDTVDIFVQNNKVHLVPRTPNVYRYTLAFDGNRMEGSTTVAECRAVLTRIDTETFDFATRPK